MSASPGRRPLSPSRSRSPSPLSRTNGNGHGPASDEQGFRVIVVSGLTKNVQRAHLEEIFGEYGRVTGLDLPLFKVCAYTCHSGLLLMVADVHVAGLNRGKAALEFETPSQAEKAVKHMDGGQLDGSFLSVQVSPFPT